MNTASRATIIATLLLFTFLVFWLAGDPLCTGCISRVPQTPPVEDSGLNVAINLASSYGTYALRSPDGTYHVGRTNGSEEYIQMMSKLSRASSQHLAPPYRDMGESFLDHPRKLRREARKKIGLPASRDVGILGDQLREIAKDLQSEAHIRVGEVVVTVPHLLALYQDDIEDACEYAGLEYVHLPHYYDPLVWETMAAFAGYGLGLCNHYKKLERCWEEEKNMTTWNLLTVHYSQHALTTALTPQHSAYGGLFEPPYRHAENFSLGLSAKDDFRDPEAYWKAVRRELREVVEFAHMGFDEPDLVVLTGDSIDTEEFMVSLKDAVLSRNPTVHSNDGLFAVAKGAAEMLMRGRNYFPKPSPPLLAGVDL
ncbi:hypothetical protein EJ08DRAFT_654057 [Tothia fuscella]|uniref:Uncharacterized protein n=1 Tax=Tothia fuscella TaxID=1048955 RepID=A0A9P4TS94_9PEZI|nr:hypothetical protein EJ08DRAFT_654057 [Tothia fuscella]